VGIAYIFQGRDRVIDPRVRSEHVSRYGATDDVEAYLRVLDNTPTLSNDLRAENHHLLAQSIWPEWADLKENEWNRLRVSHEVHAVLTELQGRFEPRLQHAALLMRGQSTDAHQSSCIRGGKVSGMKHVKSGHISRIGKINGAIQGKRNVESGRIYTIGTLEGRRKAGRLAVESGHLASIRSHESSSRGGKTGGKIQGKINVESGHLARIQMVGALAGAKRNVELGLGLKLGKSGIGNCFRWNIRRNKSCTCGHHSAESL
jgi:hypothetical protein